MRRLSILAATVAACFLFTACPHKPTDEPTDAPVTIPDGMYEETAHSHWRHMGSWMPSDTVRDTFEIMVRDSVFTTQVMVAGGDFIYPDMCKDTVDTLRNGTPILADHFIYSATHYCNSNRVPARTDNGYVILEQPHFTSNALMAYGQWPDSSYVYRARVSRTEEGYAFRQVHCFSTEINYYSEYDISHTLRPL